MQDKIYLDMSGNLHLRRGDRGGGRRDGRPDPAVRITTSGTTRPAPRPEDRASRPAAAGRSPWGRAGAGGLTVGRSGVARGDRLARPRRGTSMLDRRRWARHGRAGALLFAVAFLALSLVGYDPADPPGHAAEPANDPPRQPLRAGRGDRWPTSSFSTVGRASYLVLFAAGRRRPPGLPPPEGRRPGLRLLGFGLVVAGRLGPGPEVRPGPRSRRPPVGSGGYVGARAVAFLEGQFGPAGMLLILAAARARRPGALPRRPDRLADPGAARP